MTGLRSILVLSAVLMLVGGCAWVIKLSLEPDMRDPRGYYVQKEDPNIYIEFSEKPKARSNVVREFGDAEYFFSAFDGEIDLYGPLTAPKEKQRHFEIVGEGANIRVQDLSAEPVGPERVFPITRYERKK